MHVIKDHEELALALVTGLNRHNCYKLIGHGFGDQTATEIASLITIERDAHMLGKPFTSFDDFADLDMSGEEIDNLRNWALDEVTAQHQLMLDKLERRHTAKTLNRSRYLPEPVLIYREFERTTSDEGVDFVSTHQGWRFHMMLRSAGLIGLMVENLFGHQNQPVAVQLVNMLPKAIHPNTGDETVRPNIPAEQWVNANNHGIAISGERVGWNMANIAWQKFLLNTFPNAVWLSAYGHSLMSPALPEGYWPNISVQFQKLVDPEGNDLGTDGSGLWNIDHPAFTAFITRHGICSWQIRGLQPRHGVFAKGAVRPMSLGADGPAFILDWNQIKGLKKEDAMRYREGKKFDEAGELITTFIQKGMHISCMQVWNKPRATLKSCFEMLENFIVNETTCGIVERKIDNLLAKMEKRGTQRILSQVCDDDPRMAQTVQLINKFRELGADITSLQVPMIRKAVQAKLERILWHVAQGAGISYQQRICILDNTVVPGTIVATGVKPGTVITTFRFPMVLAQGLRTLTAAEPKPHMLCAGKPIQCTVFMHPSDLVTCMQGDDDGDIVGISTDEDMVELFQHLVDNRIYHIEPEGRPVWHDTNSPEGLAYLRWDHRGPVGLATNYRSSLLAVGDIGGANAMSIIIQECVDAPKRTPDWSDFRAAAHIENWTEDEAGEYHFTTRLTEEDLEEGGLPIQMMEEWVHERLIARGCAKVVYKDGQETVVPDRATAWRWPNKRVNLDKWVPTAHRSGWKGGNLVHHCHDYAWHKFQPLKDMFNLDGPTIDMSLLLPMMLAAKGVAVTPIGGGDWNVYNQGLRRKSGLRAFGLEMHRIHETRFEGDQKQLHHERIDTAIATLNHTLEKAKLSVDEIVTIWLMEINRLDPKTGLPAESGINNAFRVLTTPNNEVLAILGINKSASCNWINQLMSTKRGTEARVDIAVRTSMQARNPQEHLANAIYSDTNHQTSCNDEDGQSIPLWQCNSCVSTATDALVRKIRGNRESSESLWLRGIMTTMNRTKVP